MQHGSSRTREKLANMTRLEFIAAWKEHRERILLAKYDGDARLGQRLAHVGKEALEFWKKHKPYLLTVGVNTFFARVLSAYREDQNGKQ